MTTRRRALFVELLVVALGHRIPSPVSSQRVFGSLILSMVLAALFVAPGTLRAQERNPERNAYFGETHIHTSYSLDAWTFGDRVTNPGDSYRFFKGEPIKAPGGYDVKVDTPLDFAGVTDHSEYVGVIALANDPNSPISKIPARSR